VSATPFFFWLDMAFSTADREAVQQAMVTIAAGGVASVTVDGMTVTAASLSDLQKLLSVIDTQLQSESPQAHFGLRNTQLISPGGWS
jgi:hypothetical protein